MKKIEEFKKTCQDSIAVNLLLPNLETHTIYLGKESGFQASIAYCAWQNNYLK